MFYLCVLLVIIESIIDDEDNFVLFVNWIVNGYVLFKVLELMLFLWSYFRNYCEIFLGSF